MTHAERFIAEIDAFLTRAGMSASAFGRSAVNDPNFVGDIRAGRMPNLGLVDRVHAFIKAHDSPPATQPVEQGDDQQHAHPDGGASAEAVDAHAEVTS